MKLNELSIRDERVHTRIFWVCTFTLLTAFGAQIEIPNQPVPFTLQTFFVLMAGSLLGKRDGAISMSIYLLLGAIGLPVFSGSVYGLARIIGPTGGYLIAFPIAAYVIGYLVTLRKEYWWMLISISVGSFIIFSLGTIQLNFIYFHNWMNSIHAGFLIFSWWDILKIVGAATIAHNYYGRIKK